MLKTTSRSQKIESERKLYMTHKLPKLVQFSSYLASIYLTKKQVCKYQFGIPEAFKHFILAFNWPLITVMLSCYMTRESCRG